MSNAAVADALRDLAAEIEQDPSQVQDLAVVYVDQGGPSLMVLTAESLATPTPDRIEDMASALTLVAVGERHGHAPDVVVPVLRSMWQDRNLARIVNGGAVP